jgi:O-antigen/teichoic acid export membrane protein
MPQASVKTYESTASRGVGKLARGVSQLASGTVRRTGISLLDQAVFSATSFLTAVLIARSCSVAELGTYYLILTLLYVMRGVQAEMVTAPYTIFRCRYQAAELKAYTGSILAHQAVILLLSILSVAGMFVADLAGLLPAGVAAVLPVLLVAVPVVLLRDFVRQFSFAELRYDRVAILDAFVLVIQLGCLGMLFLRQNLSAGTAYAAITSACALSVAGWWMLDRPAATVAWNRVGRDWITNWGFARWALASQLVCSCTPYFVVWMVAWLRDESVTGVLAACASLIGLSSMFIAGVGSVLTPTAARAYADEGTAALKRVLAASAMLFLAVLGVLGIAVFFVGELLMVTIYGAAFADSGTVCTVLAVNALVTSIAIVMCNGFWALNRPRANLPADIVGTLLTLGAAFALTPPLGALGAALAILGGTAAGTLVRGVMLYQHLGDAPDAPTQTT